MSDFTVSSNVDSFMQSATYAAMKILLSLDAVENTALSTWGGSANIVTVGALTSGSTGAGFTIALGSATVTGTLAAAQMPALTGDVTTSAGAVATTLATTTVAAGAYGSATSGPTFTVDTKGRLTAAGSVTITPAESSITFTDITTNNVSITKHGFAPKLPNDSTQFLNGVGAFAVPPGATSGTVTATGGALTANAIVLGAGGTDTKVSTGITTNGGSTITLGVTGSSTGLLVFNNATSGSLTLAVPSGALGSVTNTLQAVTDTVVYKATTDSLSNKTLVTASISNGLTAIGSGSNNFSGSTGAFQTSSGANTFNGVATFTPPVRASGVAAYLTINMPSDTGQTTTAESIGVNYGAGTRTWADGTTTLQRERVFSAPTYNKTTTSATFTTAINVDIADPIAGTGVTFTNKYALRAASENITGNSLIGGTQTVTGHVTFEGVTSTGATGTGLLVFGTSPTFVTPALGTPTSGALTNCTFPTLNQNTSGSAASLSVSGQTGLMTVTGLISTNRIKTIRDAADTILELGGSYTPTGTWTSMALASPTVTGTLTANTGTNLIGPLVDSVDGTTPLNNVLTTIAAGTVYTLTATNADVTFGTTSPTVTLANAGTYWISVTIQTNIVGATYASAFQAVTYNVRRTNNTAADLTGTSFQAVLNMVALTTQSFPGPVVTIGAFKYTTANTTDVIGIRGILSATPAAGSVTVSAVTITAVRAS